MASNGNHVAIRRVGKSHWRRDVFGHVVEKTVVGVVDRNGSDGLVSHQDAALVVHPDTLRSHRQAPLPHVAEVALDLTCTVEHLRVYVVLVVLVMMVVVVLAMTLVMVLVMALVNCQVCA